MRQVVLACTTSLVFDQRMQRAAEALATRYAVTLLGREWPGAPALLSRPFVQHRLPVGVAKGPRMYVAFNAALLHYLLRQRPHLIYSADADTMPACWLAAKWLGVPLVFDAHEYFSEVPEVIDRPLVRGLWQLVERAFIPGTDARLTVSATLAAHMSKVWGLPFATVRNVPAGVSEAVTTTPPQEPYFVYSGAVNRGRGLEQLVSLWQPHWPKLIICGEGDLLASLQEQTRENSQIVFTGNLPLPQLRSYISGTIAGFNLLANEGLSYYYSAANKFFDYVTEGVPQICIDFPEYRLLNHQHRVAVLVPLETSAITQAIESLLPPSPLAAELSANTQAARQTWHWDQEQHKLLALVEETFAKRNS